MIDAPGQRWFILHVITDAVPHLLPWLKNLGYEARYLKYMRKRRKQNSIEVAALPGYIFVRLELGSPDWGEIQNLSGAIRFLVDGDEPYALCEGIFEKFCQDLASTYDIPVSSTQFDALRAKLTKGMSGVVTSGPLAAFHANVLDDETNSGDVRAEVVIFGRSTIVTMPAAHIKAT